MAETENATPPAATGGSTGSPQAGGGDVAAMIALAIKPITERLEESEKNLKTVADTLAAQKVLDIEGVRKLIADDAEGRAATAKDAAVKEKADAEAKAAADAAREKFAAENLAGVPTRYQADLGDDPAAWEAKGKEIRAAFAADLKAAGVKTADVGGAAGGEAVAGKGTGGEGFLKMPGGRE